MKDQAVQVFKGPVGEFGPLCSPDGRWLAFEYFTSKNIGDTEIWIMSNSGKAGDVSALLNQKTLEYGEIAWSPDSASLSFIGNRPVNSGAMTEQVFSVNDDRSFQQVLDAVEVKRAELGPAGADDQSVGTFGRRVG